MRQSKPDFDFNFSKQVLNPFEVISSSLGSGIQVRAFACSTHVVSQGDTGHLQGAPCRVVVKHLTFFFTTTRYGALWRCQVPKCSTITSRLEVPPGGSGQHHVHVPQEQKMLTGHLPRVMYHQLYQYTKNILLPVETRAFPGWHVAPPSAPYRVETRHLSIDVTHGFSGGHRAISSVRFHANVKC